MKLMLCEKEPSCPHHPQAKAAFEMRQVHGQQGQWSDVNPRPSKERIVETRRRHREP